MFASFCILFFVFLRLARRVSSRMMSLSIIINAVFWYEFIFSPRFFLGSFLL